MTLPSVSESAVAAASAGTRHLVSIGPRPVSCVVTGAECSAPGQEAPIPHDDRNGGQRLQERGQGAGIHDIGEVVANETAGIQLLTGEVAEMLLRGVRGQSKWMVRMAPA